MADELFVARDEDLAVLNEHYQAALAGTPQALRLQAPFGGGRRALVGRFLNEVQKTGEDAVLWRVVCLDQENGLAWLVRMYGALIAQLTQDVLRRGKIEMVLNGQLPSQPKRVQGWFQQFIASMKEAKPDAESGSIQLKLPQDNPLIGLVEVTIAIAKKMPVVLELQNPNVVYSLTLAMFVETLLAEAKANGAKLFVILHDEVETEATKALYPMPLVDLYAREDNGVSSYAIPAWGADEAQKYLDSKGLTGNAARIAEIAGGRPGFIAEATEILEAQGRLADDLTDVSFASLVPLTVDADELELPEEPPAEGERKHAGPEDAARVAQIAALLGQVFPSGLVADMAGFDRDSVDDLLDAMDDTFEEMQFSDDLGTWLYKFRRGSWREGVTELNDNEEGHELARRVGAFMERFLVPRGYGFIVKTARVYAEHGALNRASVMRSIALSNDAPDVWGLSYDLTKYFDEITWPDPLQRTIFMNLVDRMVSGGGLQAADQVVNDATAWATERDDKEMMAWLLFNGSRLDLRRQDLYRARDRARDAITVYEGLNQPLRIAEIHNHLASIELQDGNVNAAQENLSKALQLGQVKNAEGQTGVIPSVAGHAEYLRGQIQRRAGNIEEASKHFRTANEIAGQAGAGPLALDAGLAFGEALLAGRQVEQARDVLRKVVGIAQSLRSPVRERSAFELLAQAEGALKNFEGALQCATRTLQLSQQLRFEQVLPIDLYNLGFFNYALNKPTEALTYFRQAETRVASLGNHPVVKELHYFKGMAHLKTGEVAEAKRSLGNALAPARNHKDWPKLISAMDQLAVIESQGGNNAEARTLLNQAIEVASQQNLKDQRKSLRKRLDGLA